MGVAREVLAACTRDATFGDAWVEGLRLSRGASLSDAQYACLREGFLGLSVGEVSLVQLSVTAPGSVDANAAEALVAGLFEGCGVAK